jgi:hypothetical protein
MANYAYLLSLSGFRYSAPRRTLYLHPVIFQDDFRCFFSLEGAWGVIRRRKSAHGDLVTIEVLEGELELERVIVDGEEVPYALQSS